MSWLQQAIKSPCETAIAAAKARQQQLTKPAGSLGQLETLAIQLAGLQATATPAINNIAISIFAADHGIANEQVSAFPQAVTAEMIKNFAHGGAAIAVIAKQLNAELRVSNLGTVSPLDPIAGVEDNRLAAGTANFAKEPAMSEEQLQQALAIGKKHIDEAIDKTIDKTSADLFIGGEMGIANTTSATALACALLQQPAAALTGPGTGISPATQQHKQRVIEAALAKHQLNADQPLECLRVVGGFEIAALTGAFIRGAQIGMPLLVDGFIASIAALTALQFQPDIAPWLILGHQSAEPGHRAVVAALDKTPVLQLQMRLGEASGAGCAVPLLQLACALHNNMATFDSANISTATI